MDQFSGDKFDSLRFRMDLIESILFTRHLWRVNESIAKFKNNSGIMKDIMRETIPARRY